MLDENRFNVFACHRRFGKTVCLVNHLIKRAIEEPKKNARLAYIAPTFRQASRIAWDYLKQFAQDIPGVKFHTTELRADFPNGARISLLGSENVDSLRGIYLDFCAIDEIADIPESLFPLIIRPALSDRKGSCAFVGTPRGHNLFHDYWQTAGDTKDWARRMFKASETNILDADELEAAKASMTADQYAQEFECSWVANTPGSIWGKELQQLDDRGEICSVPYDPRYRVDVHWDIGMHDYTALIFTQSVGRGKLHVIDGYQARGEGMPHYARILDEKDYLYGTHYGPHDLEVREIGTGKSRREAAYELGIRFQVLPRIPLEDGIHAARMLIPRCCFDRENCRELLEALRHYHRAYDERNRTFKDKPVHDFSSHYADAWRYCAQAIEDTDEDREAPQRYAESDYNVHAVAH